MATHNIGWYVHYHKENYKKYGLGYNEKSKENMVTPSELNAFKKEMISQIRRNISESQIAQFEKLFNDFAYGMTNVNKEDEQIYLKTVQKMMDILSTTIYQKYSLKKSQLLTGPENLGNLTGKNNLKQINTKNHIKTVQMYIKELDLLWKNCERMTNHLNYAEIQQNKQKFYDCSAKLKKLINQYKMENPKIGSNFYVMYNKGDVGAELKSVMKTANELLKLNTLPTENQISGIYAEEFTNLLTTVTQQGVLSNKEVGLKEVYKALLNFDKLSPNVRVSGADRSSTTKDETRYAKGIIKYGNKDFFVSTQATYNKADVEITYSDKKIGTSVKNYGFFNNKNGTGRIGLVDGVSMDDLIDNMNTTFVNHWLNLKTKVKKGTSSLDGLRLQADTVMKIGILARAASGNLSGRSGVADILAINSRHGKRWRFISIYKLIDDIVKTNNLKSATFTGYPSEYLNQSWSGSPDKRSSAEAMRRIAMVLANLEKKKISVQLKVSDIKTGRFII